MSSGSLLVRCGGCQKRFEAISPPDTRQGVGCASEVIVGKEGLGIASFWGSIYNGSWFQYDIGSILEIPRPLHSSSTIICDRCIENFMQKNLVFQIHNLDWDPMDYREIITPVTCQPTDESVAGTFTEMKEIIDTMYFLITSSPHQVHLQGSQQPQVQPQDQQLLQVQPQGQDVPPQDGEDEIVWWNELKEEEEDIQHSEELSTSVISVVENEEEIIFEADEPETEQIEEEEVDFDSEDEDSPMILLDDDLEDVLLQMSALKES